MSDLQNGCVLADCPLDSHCRIDQVKSDIIEQKLGIKMYKTPQPKTMSPSKTPMASHMQCNKTKKKKHHNQTDLLISSPVPQTSQQHPSAP